MGPTVHASGFARREVHDVRVNLRQILFVLADLVLWLWLLNAWRLKNWRAVTVGIFGTVAMLLAGLFPPPAGALGVGGSWLAVAWIFVIHPEMVSVITPEEYDYVDAHVLILRRIGRRKHAASHLDPVASVAEFESDVQSLARLTAPSEWSLLHERTVIELRRRLTIMKGSTAPSPEDMRAGDEEWLEIGQLFRDTLKARAGFWTGWPHLIRRQDA